MRSQMMRHPLYLLPLAGPNDRQTQITTMRMSSYEHKPTPLITNSDGWVTYTGTRTRDAAYFVIYCINDDKLQLISASFSLLVVLV